jgi:hypothetical protein
MKKNFLLFFSKPDILFAKQAISHLRSKGVQVLAVYGNTALEAVVPVAEKQNLTAPEYFSLIYEDEITKRDMETMGPEAKQIAATWNLSVKKFGSLLNEEDVEEGISWGADDHTAPGPSLDISGEFFLEVLQKNNFQPDESLLPYNKTEENPSFESIRQRLLDSIKDETKVYHLARLIVSNPELEETIFSLPQEVLDDLFNTDTRYFSETRPGFAGFGLSCKRMLGDIAVGVVFVESSRDDEPSFSMLDRTTLVSQIQTGLNWLATQNLTGNVSWIIDYQFLMMDINNGVEQWWRPNAVLNINYRGNRYFNDWVGLGNYRSDMKEANNAADAFVIFITPFQTHLYAYTSNQRVVISNKDGYGGWGITKVNAIAAHETCHIFGAADEYTGSGTPCSSCFTTHGCSDVFNMNCQACAAEPVACVMDVNYLAICKYTMKMIGWALPLRFTPTVLNFGSVNRGQSRVLILRIKNQSMQAFTLVIPPPVVSSVFQWTGFNGILSAGQERAFTFTFTPRTNAVERTVIRITSSAPGKPHSIGLVGKGPGGF